MFNITVTATDGNTCSGSAPYTFTINCQTVTVTNPATTTVQAGVPLDVTFTATGILGTVTWSKTGDTLPGTLALNSTTGHLTGTANATGTFNITVKAQDTNGCFGTSAYTLTVTCPTITVTRTGGGTFPNGVFNTAYAGQSVVATGGGGSYTYAIASGALPTGLSFTAAGAITGTATATGNFTFTITATDTASNCTGTSASLSIAIAPAANPDSYGAANNIIDNVQFVITGGSTTNPGTPFVGATGNILTNDSSDAAKTATAGIFATTGGGSVTIAADGTFIYTPGVHAGPITNDTFNYTVVSNGVTSVPATVTLTLANRVWFVKNNGAAGNGHSQNPFNTLAAAQIASTTGDIIFVYNGNNTTSGQNAGITLKANQLLIGEGSGLTVNTVALVPAGTRPLIGNAAGDAVSLAAGNTVEGLDINGSNGNGIFGVGIANFTGDNLAIHNTAASMVGLRLTNVTGTVTLTNSTISNSFWGLLIGGGTATVNIDNTNTISSGAGQRTVVVQSRGAGANPITIGATINENGDGIDADSNTAGTLAFTGVLTLNTTSNAVNLIANSGTSTFTFSGSLAITTTTGIGFNATGGGTLNVAGTAATITTGAAANAINLNGLTVGSSGVTFTNLISTGATTAVALTNVNGLVSINGGTITNGTTAVSLGGSSTSLTLSNTTITGPTSGITTSSAFGTLTLNSDNISAGTAIALIGGTLAGTNTVVSATGGQGLSLNGTAIAAGTAFSSVDASGGANGISLVNVTGSPLAINGGTLANHTTSSFSVNGGSSNITFAGGITGTGFLVDITGRSGGTVTFSTGTLGGAGTLAGTGIRIQNSTGTSTFTFSGTQTLGTGGTRMANTAVTLAGNNTTTTFNFSGNLSIFTNGVTAFTATGPTGGTINFSGSDLINAAGGSALVLNGVNLGAGTLSNVTSTGGVNGISLTTVTGGTLTIGAGSLTGAAGATFLVSGGNVSVTDAGTITQATAALPAVSVSAAHGTGTLTFNGAVTATNGTGLQFDNADGTYNFNSAANALSGGARVDILNNSGGTFSFASGMTITNGAGTASFNVSASAPTVTYSGSITTNSLRPVSISNAAAAGCGTITFQTGNITATAGSNAILVNNCNAGTVTFSNPSVSLATTTNAAVSLTTNAGATIVFSGGNLAISTTSGNGITATGGGVLNVTGASNSISTTSGTGINWNGLTGTSTETFNTLTSTTSGVPMSITSSGATNFTVGTVSSQTGTAVSIATATGDFVFTKINSNGAAKGITVSALTGGGSFTVNGTGGLCDSTHVTAADCTGGTILGGTTRGGEFNNVAALTLNNMYFNGNATSAVACGDDVVGGTNTTCNAGLYMVSVTAPSLTKIYVNGTGSNDSAIIGNAVSAMTVSTLEIANFTNAAKTPFNFQNLTGTTGITGLNVHNNSGLHNVMITNNTGTANVTLTSPTLTNNSGSGNPDGIQVNSYLAGTTLNVTATNVNVTASSINTGNGVMFQANSGSSMTSILNGGVVTGTNGILMQETGTNTTFTFTVTGLTSVTTHNLGSNAITVGKGNGTNATFNGTVTNNVITSATCGGGCAGIKVASFGVSGASTVNVTNNNISGVDAQGIWVVGGQGGSSLTATVQNNNIHNPALTSGINTSYAIDIYPGTQSGDAVCFAVNLGDMTASHTVAANRNTITGAWQSGGNPIEVGIFNSSVFKLLNYTGTTDANAASWVSASNGGLGTDAFHLGTNQFTAGASCP
jgi:hypothetical protein